MTVPLVHHRVVLRIFSSTVQYLVRSMIYPKRCSRSRRRRCLTPTYMTRFAVALLSVLCWLFHHSVVDALTSISSNPLQVPPPQQHRTPIQRVAIIGAGVAGLTVAHGLEAAATSDDSTCSIAYDLLDARPGVDEGIGAGIQLNGGLHVLGKLNAKLRDAVYAAGLPQQSIRSEAWYSDTSTCTTDTDDTDGDESTKKHRLFELDLPSLIRSSRDPQVVESLTDDSDDRVWWVSILRSTLQRLLVDALPPPPTSSASARVVQWNKRLVGLEPADTTTGESSSSSYCVFADGTKTGPYQVVVGCEGINSVLKGVVDGRKKPNSSSRRTALYSGIRIRFAVGDDVVSANKDGTTTPSTTKATTSSSFVQHLGRGIYALDSIYGGGGAASAIQRCAFIVYLDPNRWGPLPRLWGRNDDNDDDTLAAAASATAATTTVEDENADWRQEQQLDAMRSTMQQQLLDGGIHDPALQATIASATQCFELGSYFHSPFGAWSSQPQAGQAQVVLCGDAAHALPPFLGQGANQAMQDAYCLTQRLVAYNADVANSNAPSTTPSTDPNNDAGEPIAPLPKTLHDYCKEYEQRRWPATTSILVKSIFLGYLETGGFDGVFGPLRNNVFRFLFAIGVVPKILLGAAVPRV